MDEKSLKLIGNRCTHCAMRLEKVPIAQKISDMLDLLVEAHFRAFHLLTSSSIALFHTQTGILIVGCIFSITMQSIVIEKLQSCCRYIYDIVVENFIQIAPPKKIYFPI